MRVVLMVGLWWLMWGVTPLAAQSPEPPDTPSRAAPLLMVGRAAQNGDAVTDVRSIFDVSGSMRNNDPEQLSGSALELMVALVPSGAHGGLWTFGTQVENPLPMAPVDQAWRERALALKPALVDYQSYTDIEAAIRQAGVSSGEGEADSLRHLILLTDGVIDLPADGQDKAARDAASRRALTEQLAPALTDEGVVIHAIAFSSEADLALVERLAQSSNGLASLAETPDALLRAFLDILQRIFPIDQVPLDAGRFNIDSQVDSFTALLFHEPGASPLALEQPDGHRFTHESPPGEVRWQSEPRFDLVTVPSPQPGEWRIEGAIGEASRIGIDSSLTLRTGELPTTLYLGFDVPLSVWLVSDDGETLPLDALPDDLRLQAELSGLPGSTQSATRLAPEGARFAGVLPAPTLTGNAHLLIDASSQAFQRQRIQAVNVLPAIATQVDSAQTEVLLQAEHPRLNAGNTRLSAELQGEALEVEIVEERRWRIALPELPDTRVPLLLSANVTLDGETFEIRLPRVLLNGEAHVGLDAARTDSAELQSEPLPSEPEPAAPADDTPSPADRVVNAINLLPQQAQALWQEAIPRAEEVARKLGMDPQTGGRWLPWWLAGLVIVLIALWGWRRRHVRRRPRRRRSPSM